MLPALVANLWLTSAVALVLILSEQLRVMRRRPGFVHALWMLVLSGWKEDIKITAAASEALKKVTR